MVWSQPLKITQECLHPLTWLPSPLCTRKSWGGQSGRINKDHLRLWGSRKTPWKRWQQMGSTKRFMRCICALIRVTLRSQCTSWRAHSTPNSLILFEKSADFPRGSADMCIPLHHRKYHRMSPNRSWGWESSDHCQSSWCSTLMVSPGYVPLNVSPQSWCLTLGSRGWTATQWEPHWEPKREGAFLQPIACTPHTQSSAHSYSIQTATVRRDPNHVRFSLEWRARATVCNDWLIPHSHR